MRTKKIRVLVLTSSFPRSKKDWWARFVVNVYKNLPSKKYDVTVIAPHSPGSKFTEKMGRISVLRFPYFYPYKFQVLTNGNGILHSAKNPVTDIQIGLFLLFQFFFVFLHLVRNRYDVIHAHWILPQGLVGLVMKYLFGIPLVITVHGSDVFGLRKLNPIKSIVLRYATHTTANSHATYRAVQKLSTRASVSLIPMGIDTSVFTPRGKKRKRSDEKLIIAVGRLITCKGYRYLLLSLPTILRKIKHLRLLMIGTGPEESTLQALTQKLKIQKYVRFLGNISHADLAEYYKNSDLFIAPAVTDPKTGEKEGQGLAILEAMASGIPVVASRSGGIKYIIQNNVTGILVPERDVNALSAAAIGILRKKSTRDLLVKNGLREIRRIYTWEKISKSFDALFDRIVNHA